MPPETNTEIAVRHDEEAVGVLVLRQEICGLKELMLEKLHNQDVALSDIKTQTTKTNGTVADIKKWRERATGAATIVSSVVLPLIFGMLTYLLYLHIKN